MANPIVPTPDTLDNLKRCNKCGERKPISQFGLSARRPDGHDNSCLICRRKQSREYNSNPYVKELRKAVRERYNAKPESKEKNKARGKQRNKEQRHAYNREYHARNRERIVERKREYRAANHALIAGQLRQYRQTDAGKAANRAGKHRRRARKLAAGGTFTVADLAAIRAAQTDKHGKLRCWKCGKPIKGTPHLDHWMPISKGGRNDAGNLHYMHRKCNLEKYAKLPTEIGRLI